MRRAAHRTRGQSIVEFALVVPLFLLLMLALIDFSRLLFTYISMANGAREMARVVAVSTNWSTSNPAAAVNSFNNYTIVAGGQNSGTDKITVRYGNDDCARTLDLGGTCPSSGAGSITSATCTLPLSTTSCTPALSAPPQGGFVEVQVSYTFQFNPLFQNRLDGIIDVSFMRPTALVTTTSRAYVE
ncbi:MAG TPA: TadE family protein [Chloroflexota bacterium]